MQDLRPVFSTKPATSSASDRTRHGNYADLLIGVFTVELGEKAVGSVL